MRSSLRSDEIQGIALDEIKSAQMQPCEAGSHCESDFIHQRWIPPVEDGFDCVIRPLRTSRCPLFSANEAAADHIVAVV